MARPSHLEALDLGSGQGAWLRGRPLAPATHWWGPVCISPSACWLWKELCLHVTQVGLAPGKGLLRPEPVTRTYRETWCGCSTRSRRSS